VKFSNLLPVKRSAKGREKQRQECPEEVRETILEIIEVACLNIRVAGWGNHADYCAMEADHIHNLPSLLQKFRIEELRWYLDLQRNNYLHLLQEHCPEYKGQSYDALWKKLEEALQKLERHS